MSTLNVSASNGNGAVAATTTAAGQSITVTNTATTTASTITAANFANQTITTGSGGDGITVSGGGASTGISVNAGAGADTVTATLATAWSGLGNSLNGGSNLTGTVDTLNINYDVTAAAAATLDLAAMITAGDIAGFEKLTTANQTGANLLTVTAGTGFTQYDFSGGTDAVAVNASIAQAVAITSLVFDAADTSSLVIVPATGETTATIDYSTDTLTAVDLINFGSTIPMTFSFPAAAVTAVTQTGTGSAATTFNAFGTTFTNAAAAAPTLVASPAQAPTAVSTGAVTLNIARDDMQVLTADDVGDITLVSAAGATTSLVITDATTTTYDADGTNTAGAVTSISLSDADLAFTGANLDSIVVGNVSTAQEFTFTTGLAATSPQIAVPVNATETGSSEVVYTFVTDNVGTADTSLVITGFDAGATGDKLLLVQRGQRSWRRQPVNANIATTGFGFDAYQAAL